MKQLRNLLKREFYLFFTNKTMLSVFFLAPILYALLMGFTYKSGKVTDIPVIIVNHDRTPLSNQVVDMLEDNKTIKVLNYIDEPAVVKDEMIKTEAGAIIIIPERLNDILKAIYFQKLNISKLRTVTHNNKIKFILIEGKKGSRPGNTVVDTVLF